jgi:Secretion system C-terminal sorting domain
LKNLILVFLTVFICVDSNGQGPTIQWQRSFGGSIVDELNYIVATADGGYILAGSTSSSNGDVTVNHGGGDYWVVKINDTGGIQWQKSLGGTFNENGTSIQKTRDGGYIVSGYSNSNDIDVTGHHGSTANPDYWLVKLNDTGAIQWQKSLGGTNGELGWSMATTFDGGYVVAGNSYSNDGDVTGNHGSSSDYWVVKLNDTGGIQWQKSLGGTFIDYARSIQQTADSGYIVAGAAQSNNGDVSGLHGNYDYWIVKLNDTGGIRWQKCLGGFNFDDAYWIEQTSDHGYIVAGNSRSINGNVTGNHGGDDCWIVKLDDTGRIQWQKSLGGSLSDGAASIQQTTDGGYIVGGSSNSNDLEVSGNHGSADCWVVKLDDTGAIQWQKSLGGSGSESASCIRQTGDGYIITGSSNSTDGDVTGNHGNMDAWVVKLNCNLSAGVISGLTTVCIGHTLTLADTATGGVWSVANAHASVVGGVVTGVSAGVDTVYYTKTNSCGSAVASFVVTVTSCPTGVGAVGKPAVTITPNPTTGIISMTGINNARIKVYNTVGQVVKEERNTNTISIAEMAAGLYFVRVWDEDGEMVKIEKVIKNP